MSHLVVELYERCSDRFPCCTLEDHDVSDRQYFHDLHRRGSADRAARVIVRPGDEYRIGDHIRLLDKVRRSHTHTIAIDPAVADDVDLNEVPVNEHSFAERAEAVLFITNPNIDSSYRLRVTFYTQVGQKIPSLILYDWECPSAGSLTDLNCFHLARRAAFIRIESGPAYQDGDRIILRESLMSGFPSYTLMPGYYDLTRFMVDARQAEIQPLIRERKPLAETITAIELKLQPTVIWH